MLNQYSLFPSHLIQRLIPKREELLPRLPKLLSKPLCSAPFFIQAKLIKQFISPFFSVLISSPDAQRLRGKWIKLDVLDIGLSVLISNDHQQTLQLKQKGRADVTISGSLKSFILLAAQKEDPDTLFFQRDLLIEGDTDLGLYVKNLLDAFDWDTLPPEMTFAVKAAGEYMNIFVH